MVPWFSQNSCSWVPTTWPDGTVDCFGCTAAQTGTAAFSLQKDLSTENISVKLVAEAWVWCLTSKCPVSLTLLALDRCDFQNIKGDVWAVGDQSVSSSYFSDEDSWSLWGELLVQDHSSLSVDDEFPNTPGLSSFHQGSTTWQIHCPLAAYPSLPTGQYISFDWLEPD